MSMTFAERWNRASLAQLRQSAYKLLMFYCRSAFYDCASQKQRCNVTDCRKYFCCCYWVSKDATKCFQRQKIQRWVHIGFQNIDYVWIIVLNQRQRVRLVKPYIVIKYKCQENNDKTANMIYTVWFVLTFNLCIIISPFLSL